MMLGAVYLLALFGGVASMREGGALCMSSGLSRLIDARNSSLDATCKNLLDAYSKRAENFVSCMLQSSKPVCFCEMCKTQYYHFREAYRNITRNRAEEGEVDCKIILLQSDRLQPVERTRTFIRTLWQDASCSECYNNSTLSENAITFYMYLNTTKRCFARFLSEISPLGNSTQISASEFSLITAGWLEYILPISAVVPLVRNDSACTECADAYNQLKSFYSHLSDHGTVCADLVDHMNITRSEWGRVFRCRDYHLETEKSMIIGGMVFLLFASFYILNYVQYIISNRTVIESVDDRIRKDLPNGVGQRASHHAD